MTWLDYTVFISFFILLGMLIGFRLGKTQNWNPSIMKNRLDNMTFFINKGRLFQHPSVKPGDWQKSLVVAYDCLNKGWIYAIFDHNMDYVNEPQVRLSEEEIEKKIEEFTQLGYREVSDFHKISHRYGIDLNEICIDGIVYHLK